MVDFQSADRLGRIRLTCVGTIKDLSTQGIRLREGLELLLYDADADDQGRPDELRAEGVVTFSSEEHRWVAVIDWDGIRHASDDERASGNGAK
jgi:hypothetical protein